MDNATCTRLAAALRPISRKNTDSKIFAAAINEQMKTSVEQRAHTIQQGFIRGRNFCNNIMIMDTLGRIAGWRPDAGSEYPVQILFDIAAAFPSLGRQWLFAALANFQYAEGFINAVHALYDGGQAMITLDGAYRFVCFMRSGVAQGCPLSGTIWAIAMD
eukprot:6855644-Pyramimonas_sp.AAC.1